MVKATYQPKWLSEFMIMRIQQHYVRDSVLPIPLRPERFGSCVGPPVRRHVEPSRAATYCSWGALRQAIPDSSGFRIQASPDLASYRQASRGRFCGN
ncbi:Protein of unknown function [Pyronema omphalodes CBS 100304]|uniref:Uncharacterized protein n=1 Tax=Pyronema omphalodes (strain CBS 100304) TaxID=1076935 RepID=U4L2S8_PYROM|nr:Protein of unknown function [Pyronema omphalodes CBS 100304]